MSGTLKLNGDGTVTAAFTYTATTDKMTTTVGDAVHYLYPQTFGEVLNAEGVLIPFDALTNQQILDVLDAWLRKNVVDLARQYERRSLLEVATAEANVAAADKYI